MKNHQRNKLFKYM